MSIGSPGAAAATTGASLESQKNSTLSDNSIFNENLLW